MDFLLRRLARTGLRRTMAGGGWAWMAVALAAYVLRRARHPADHVVSVRVKAGDRMLVSLQTPRQVDTLPSPPLTLDG